MKMRNLSLSVLLALFALCVIHSLYYQGQLPASVASHFDMSGQPDAWMNKSSFLIGSLIAPGACVLIFLVISFVMRRLPNLFIERYVNVPNKNYWLAPERRRETLDSISRSLLWPASVVLLIMTAMNHQAIRVNLGKTDTLEHPFLIIGSGLALTTVWGIWLVVKFRKTGS